MYSTYSGMPPYRWIDATQGLRLQRRRWDVNITLALNPPTPSNWDALDSLGVSKIEKIASSVSLGHLLVFWSDRHFRAGKVLNTDLIHKRKRLVDAL